MGQKIDGMGYSAESFSDLALGEYRTRFPEETKALTDENIWDIVALTEDDLDDSDWRKLFADNNAKV